MSELSRNMCRGAATGLGVAAMLSISACTESSENTYGAESYIATGFVADGANVRTAPHTDSDPSVSSNVCDVPGTAILFEQVEVQELTGQADSNGTWYGFQSEDLENPCGSEDGLLWVNGQNVLLQPDLRRIELDLD